MCRSRVERAFRRGCQNPFRFIGDYVVAVVAGDHDPAELLTQVLEKAEYFQAHPIILGTPLTSGCICDMLSIAETMGKRTRFGYVISDDPDHIELIKKEAVVDLTNVSQQEPDPNMKIVVFDFAEQ